MKDLFLIWLLALPFVTAQLDFNTFTQPFAKCKRGSPEFDKCIKDALNEVRPFFKTGVPELNIEPFDPFFAQEVIQKRGGTTMNYTLKLKNVYERGWTESMITKFKSNPTKRFVQYTQYFPEKHLDGQYEFDGNVAISNIGNRGNWNMTLYDYIQTTTLRKPENATKIKVRIEVQQIGNMDLHIGNLLRGRAVMENMLDRVINASWRPGFAVVRPLINDIVSSAFTDIFNKAFNDLDLTRILPN